MYTKQSIADLADSVRHFLMGQSPEFQSPPYLKRDTVHLAIRVLNGRLMTPCSIEEWSLCTGDAIIETNAAHSPYAFRLIMPFQSQIEAFVIEVGHQIGHLFMHLLYGSPQWKTNETFRDTITARSILNATDYEANHFANCLMMPKTEFMEINQNLNGIDEVAHHFGVSPALAAERKRNLSLDL